MLVGARLGLVSFPFPDAWLTEHSGAHCLLSTSPDLGLRAESLSCPQIVSSLQVGGGGGMEGAK